MLSHFRRKRTRPTILLRKRSAPAPTQRIIFLKTLPVEESFEVEHEVRTDGHDYITAENARCESCDESFPDASSLIIHKTERSIQRTRAALREPILRYKCDLCSECFGSKSLLNRHFRDCSEGTREGYVPRVRKRRPKVKADESREDGPVRCHMCDKIFKKEKYLKVHVTTAHQGKVSCQLCESDFDTAPELKTHMAEAHSDLEILCEVCNKSFYSHRSLKVHMVVHARDQKDALHTCEICQKTFRHEVYLRKHVQLVHVEMGDRKRFRCEFPGCEYQTHHKACFRDHVCSHTGEDQVECDICGKRMRKHHMKMHLRIHSGVKNFTCEYCGKRFTERKYLTRHRITHTGEKPYQCQFCGKKYTQRGTLTLHFRKHHPQEMSDHKKETVGKLLRDESEKEESCTVKHEEMQEFVVLEEVDIQEEVIEESFKSEEEA